MIKSITVTNYLGETAKIILDEEYPGHGMCIMSIDGLGPAKANINATDIATNDGSIFNSSRLNPRNIVIKMFFTEAPMIETARLNTYKFFPIKKPLTLEIETDTRNVKTVGYVETNEPDVFSDTESNQISIICPDPYFYAIEDGYFPFNTNIPSFEFPFEIINTIEFGTIDNSVNRNVYYDGDGDIGFDISIHVLDTPGTINIYNLLTGENMILNRNRVSAIIGNELTALDDVIISTVKGNKSAVLIRNGQKINIINCFGKDANWFQLTKGDNPIAFTATNGLQTLQIKITHQIAYEGV